MTCFWPVRPGDRLIAKSGEYSRLGRTRLRGVPGLGMVRPKVSSGGQMDSAGGAAKAERFMPDWLVGGLLRLALAPGLWLWGRAHAAAWPGVDPALIVAADIWSVPVISPAHLAQIAVWGTQICAALLLAGFLTRLVGLVLLAAASVYAAWIAPDAWPATVVFAAAAFYLFARGGGALSVDGAIVATTR